MCKAQKRADTIVSIAESHGIIVPIYGRGDYDSIYNIRKVEFSARGKVMQEVVEELQNKFHMENSDVWNYDMIEKFNPRKKYTFEWNDYSLNTYTCRSKDWYKGNEI